MHIHNLQISLSQALFSYSDYIQMSKVLIRQKFRTKKATLLTKCNQNQYHSKLRQNLKEVLKKLDLNLTRQIVIGSYINKPIYQIIPPFFNENSIRWCYPYFKSTSKQMQFFQHNTNDRYIIGSFGIKTLSNRNDKMVMNQYMDVVLVPLVCFSEQKQRIGEGGGYYDEFVRNTRQKYLSNLKTNMKVNKTKFIGLGLQGLKLEGSNKDIFESWDQKLDMIFTEQRIYE